MSHTHLSIAVIIATWYSPDGTPLICTSGKPKLFYYSDDLNTECPSCDLADRIEKVAREHPPPYFVLAYGGLQAAGGADIKSNKNFFPSCRRQLNDLEMILLLLARLKWQDWLMKPSINWNNREAARILLQFEFSFCE